MAESYSVVGVGSDGRTTTLLVNIGEAEARYIAKGMRLSEFVRIDVVAEPIHAVNAHADCASESKSRAIQRFERIENSEEV